MKTVAARPIKAEKHLWYVYKGRKAISVKDNKGQVLTLKPGDIFGLQNLNNRMDRIALPSRPDIRYILPVETSSDLLDASKRHREPVAFSPTPMKPAKIRKVKVSLDKPVKAPQKKASTGPADRLTAIKKAAEQNRVKGVVKKPKKERFDFDEDTFQDDDNSDLKEYL